jgi:RND family efflux transporter MFP subunit
VATAVGTVLGVLVSGVALSGCESSPNANAGAPPPGAAPATPPALVEVASVRTGNIDERWVFLGTARSLADATLAAGAAGEVIEVGVREGDHVDAGKILVLTDDSLTRARYSSAKATRAARRSELEQAERDRKRAQQLGEVVVPRSEIEGAEARARSLESQTSALGASVREQKAALDRHFVRAPFAGTVRTRLVDPGDWVNVGDPVLELFAEGQLEVLVDASADLAAYVQEGGKAQLVSGEHTAEAEIRGVVRALDPVTRTIKLRVMPKDPASASWLVPGASVDVAFEISRGGDGVVVPRDALVQGPVDTKVVRVVPASSAEAAGSAAAAASGGAAPSAPAGSGEVAEQVVVEIVALGEREAIVRAKGGQTLTAGDTVVIRGNERVRPGQAVTRREAQAETTGAPSGEPTKPPTEPTK